MRSQAVDAARLPRSVCRGPKLGLVLLALAALGPACTGPRPVLVEAPTLDAREYAASLPPSSVEALTPTATSAPGEPTAQDAIYTWSQDQDFNYVGTCSSGESDMAGEVCSQQVENFDVYRLGPDAEDVWWVLEVPGTDGAFRVSAVYVAGGT